MTTTPQGAVFYGDKPQPPTDVGVEVDPDGKVTVEWKPPADGGSFPVIDYVITIDGVPQK